VTAPNREQRPSWTVPLGQIAFGAYVDSVGGIAVNGDPVPEWAALPVPLRTAWTEAGKAAVRAALEMGIVRVITEIDGGEHAQNH
jgi:hypothetical protein